MNKVKVSTSLASIMLIAGLFAGWQTLLIVVALLLLFADVENVKGIIVRVVAFYVGLTLVSMAWGIIYDAYTDVLYGGIQSIVSLINSYLDKPLDITKLYAYVLDPIKIIFNYINDVVPFLLTIAKFGFIVSLLNNKAQKQNFFTKFINEFVDKVVKFVNGIDASQN